MVASTGRPWDEILDEWDIPRLIVMRRYWDKYPPVHILVAAYLDYQPPTAADNSEITIDDLMCMFPMPG